MATDWKARAEIAEAALGKIHKAIVHTLYNQADPTALVRERNAVVAAYDDWVTDWKDLVGDEAEREGA